MTPSLQRHRKAFGRAPDQMARTVASPVEQNVTACVQEGVKVVCTPQRGGKKTPEREADEKVCGLQGRPVLSRRHQAGSRSCSEVAE